MITMTVKTDPDRPRPSARIIVTPRSNWSTGRWGAEVEAVALDTDIEQAEVNDLPFDIDRCKSNNATAHFFPSRVFEDID